MEQINKQTVRQKLKSYRKSPLSLVLFLLVTISAVITAFVLFFLIAYILVKGVPHLTPELFSWTYNSENVSMLPSIVNTFLMTLLSLIIATPMGIFSAIYLV
ncbi:MAG: phosphate ABC transporter, permease protein PstA, partial [Oscillospiraceae bacterium]|nr:phosphate ABC transporter, permease protein PstA [Oscillospiraceae bacterium]